MKKVLLLAIVLFLLLMPLGAFAESNKTCVYYFYGQGCPHCAKVEEFFKQIEPSYPDLEIHSFEIYNNRTNLLMLHNFFEAYNVSSVERGIPIVFFSDKYISGDTPIIENFTKIVNETGPAECPVVKISSLSEVSPSFYLTIIGAALVDSINPCAIAVLLILMGALLIANERRKAFLTGISFIVSIYIVYFLFGLGLFSALKISGISLWFSRIVGVLAIAIGLLNIKDYLWYGAGGFVMEIPRRWRPLLTRYLTKVVTPLGGFLMGFLVCLFELPCTGGPYLFVLGLLAERATQAAAIPILLVYNVFFVAPLILITFLLYFGYSSVEKTKQWKEKNVRLLHLVAGLIMLVLGLFVIFGFV